MPTEKTGLGRVHAMWIGQDLEQSQQVPVKAIIKVEPKPQILCNQPPVWFCLQLNAGFELFGHRHGHLTTLGGRTIYVTDGILEELCHQYKDPV